MNKEIYDKGLAIRREVLGAEHVDNALRTADGFNRPLQELVTEYCWGAVWGRPGLPRKTRSLLNLAMLTALNRAPEIKLHVKGALNNGVTVAEIRRRCCMPRPIAASRRGSMRSGPRMRCWSAKARLARKRKSMRPAPARCV